ncbi:unnamed protein product [Kluyveromyces dobzhanskii CBS 2104]|uniref:WGS project CCBQ000000000 data, contig 00019 n=1 Tax=Kluyveromyces dobzhanskii CBS 2104 TaxID=1427455 RepID=A0A0A8L0B4_9SACH|nr:unnamed protein product [Kluyveromyces dobzhanskii CBS 2104]
MGRETAETSTSELFPNDYKLNFIDRSESPNGFAANPVSPRSLSKPHFSGHTAKGPPVRKTLVRPSSDYILRSAINQENNTAAIRLRNFSFPTDLQHDHGASGQELRNLSSFNNPNQSKVLSKGSQQSPQTSIASYSNSVMSSPRRVTRSGTNSSISSSSNYSPTFSKELYGNCSDAVGSHIKQEHDSEHLFNHLRFCTLTSENNNSVKLDDDGTQKSKLMPAFLLHSRKSSVDSPTRKLQDVKKRRSSSLISGSSSSTIPSTTQQSSPRSYHHKRASAMTNSLEMVSPDSLTLNDLNSDSDTNIDGSNLRKGPKSEERNQYDRNFFADDHASGAKRNYYDIPSPKLTIENTKEQIRRNSNGQFGTFQEFLELHGLQQDMSVFASLPETGDNVSNCIINLDHIHDFNPQVSPRRKMCKPHYGQRLSIAISEEDSSIDSSSSRDDELLTLMDFLNSE